MSEVSRRRVLAGLVGLSALAGCTDSGRPDAPPDQTITLKTDDATVDVDRWPGQATYATVSEVTDAASVVWLTVFDDADQFMYHDPVHHFWDSPKSDARKKLDPIDEHNTLVLRVKTSDGVQETIEPVPEVSD